MAPDRRRAERIVLPRRFPSHVIGRIVGYLVISGISAGGVTLLFGEEPRRLANGQVNVLAFLPYALIVVLVLGLVPMVISLFRRPLISADHYSLTVRPGILRTLVLPWARISQLAVYSVTLRDDPEPLLLVRCVEWHSPLGDNPGWWDQGVWRAAVKSAGGAIGGYDVAVRMSDFSGEPGKHLATIAEFAPERVSVADRAGAPAGGRKGRRKASGRAAPTSGAPTSGAPTSGAPTSGAPTSGAPTSGAPTSGAPRSAHDQTEMIWPVPAAERVEPPPRVPRRGRRTAEPEPPTEQLLPPRSTRRGRRSEEPKPPTEQLLPSAYLPPAGELGPRHTPFPDQPQPRPDQPQQGLDQPAGWHDQPSRWSDQPSDWHDQPPRWREQSPEWPDQSPRRSDQLSEWPDQPSDWHDRSLKWSDRRSEWSDQPPGWSAEPPSHGRPPTAYGQPAHPAQAPPPTGDDPASEYDEPTEQRWPPYPPRTY